MPLKLIQPCLQLCKSSPASDPPQFFYLYFLREQHTIAASDLTKMVLSFALEAVDHSLLTADVLKLDSLLLTTCLHILDTIAMISYAINWCNKFISLPIKLLAVIFTCATTSWPQNCILSPPYQGPWWHVLPAVCHHFHSVTLNVCHQSWADDVSWVPLRLIPIFVE